MTQEKSRTYNSTSAIGGVSCFYESEVLNSSFELLMKFCAKNPPPSPICKTLATILIPNNKDKVIFDLMRLGVYLYHIAC